ncbi:hypothetical protein ACJRO7_030624 [Eucalyptus globulus]|uniref:C-JID domain-containing protein n=1 Tax=Eucalyptus globulus TaxID=34317 RepID=A0ABD3JFC4_EUCGL
MTSVDILLTGREMPEWFLHCKDSSISFMVPRDLIDKFLGVAFCVVLRPKEGIAVDAECHIFINGLGKWTRRFSIMKSDTVWITYLSRRQMRIEGELLRDDWSHFQVCLTLSKVRLIKWGFRAIHEQEEDDLRIVLRQHQPNETNRSLEERDSEEDNWIDTKEEESSSETDDESSKEKLSQPNETNWPSEERDSEEDNWIDTEEEESSSETDDESSKEKLSQPNETNWPSEERYSEEDNWIDTEEEESSSETDLESNEEELFKSLPRRGCVAASACRSFNSVEKLILGSSFRQKRYVINSYKQKTYL